MRNGRVGCCARAASGHAAAALPTSMMNSRRVESRTGAVAWARTLRFTRRRMSADLGDALFGLRLVSGLGLRGKG
jgi:hypothetical protein